MKKELKLLIPKESNPYYRDNPKLFDELLELVQDHYKTFATILYAKGRKKDGYNWKCEYLVKWIDSSLPVLSDQFYKTNTKIYWILNGLAEFPKCRTCGSDELMRTRNIKLTVGYPVYCCNRCQVTSTEFKRDRIETWEKNYGKGVTSPSKSPAVREKQRRTCMRNHGVEYPMQSKEILEHGLNTKVEKYGDRNYVNVDKARETRYAKNGGKWEARDTAEKRKNTCIVTYGVEYIGQSEDVKKLSKERFLAKYGVESMNQLESVKETKRKSFEAHYGEGITTYSQTQEFKDMFKDPNYVKAIQNKVSDTKRRNGTFNTSKQEEKAFTLLLKVFPDLVRQYRSEVYPFHCDFYSPSFDLYIEYNGTWTHGGHEFDPNCLEDMEKLKKWKSKGMKYYDIAIKTWTDLDKRKFAMARTNDLNYVVFWNISDIEHYVNDFFRNLCLIWINKSYILDA